MRRLTIVGSKDSAVAGLDAFICANCCSVSISCGGVAGVLVGTACEGGRRGGEREITRGKGGEKYREGERVCEGGREGESGVCSR